MGSRQHKRSCLLPCMFASRICLVLMVCRATGEVILSRSLSDGVEPKLKYSGVVSNWIAVLWERVKK